MAKYNVTVMAGDGIGPEVTQATIDVLNTVGLAFYWDYTLVGQQAFEKYGVLLPQNTLDSIEKNKVILKGPIMTPIGDGFRSINVALRKKYDLYANIRPVTNQWSSQEKNMDMVIFRENTEGLYMGLETQISESEAHAIKIVTREGSKRIIRAAFDYAKEHNINKVTVVHKANILKLTDGLFLEIAREISKDYGIHLEEMIIDNMCMQMVMHPEQFNVIVTMNLYGDILSDLAAGLVGGLGLIPSANIGVEIAMFEAVHGTAPSIAGQNIANPIAMILSGALMLKYLGETDKAICLESAVYKVLKDGLIKTQDLGGHHSTEDMKNAIIQELKVLLC